jgi:hypothetical protein
MSTALEEGGTALINCIWGAGDAENEQGLTIHPPTPSFFPGALTCYLYTPAPLNLAFLVVVILGILYYSDTVARTIDSNKRFSLTHAPFCALI